MAQEYGRRGELDDDTIWDCKTCGALVGRSAGKDQHDRWHDALEAVTGPIRVQVAPPRSGRVL